MFQYSINFIYTISLVCWIGSIVFFSFFTAPAVFKTLDREKAGELIGRIFPRYYFIGYVCGGLVLLTLLIQHPTLLNIKMPFLLIMLACTFYAGLIVRPKAAELKERMKEHPDKRESLEAAFKTVHSLSVKLNASVLLAGVALVWLTATGLQI